MFPVGMWGQVTGLSMLTPWEEEVARTRPASGHLWQLQTARTYKVPGTHTQGHSREDSLAVSE